MTSNLGVMKDVRTKNNFKKFTITYKLHAVPNDINKASHRPAAFNASVLYVYLRL